MAWSITDEHFIPRAKNPRRMTPLVEFGPGPKYEFSHGDEVIDMVIGREGTPLENQILSISADTFCRVSDIKNGAKVTKIGFDDKLTSIAVDEHQTLVAIGDASSKITFIETSNFTKIREVIMKQPISSLAFNKRSDCMLAVAGRNVYSFKF